jgi:hypothetical protein
MLASTEARTERWTMVWFTARCKQWCISTFFNFHCSVHCSHATTTETSVCSVLSIPCRRSLQFPYKVGPLLTRHHDRYKGVSLSLGDFSPTIVAAICMRSIVRWVCLTLYWCCFDWRVLRQVWGCVFGGTIGLGYSAWSVNAFCCVIVCVSGMWGLFGMAEVHWLILWPFSCTKCKCVVLVRLWVYCIWYCLM